MRTFILLKYENTRSVGGRLKNVLFVVGSSVRIFIVAVLAAVGGWVRAVLLSDVERGKEEDIDEVIRTDKAMSTAYWAIIAVAGFGFVIRMIQFAM